MHSLSRVDSKSTMFSLAILMITGMGVIQMQPVLGGALVDGVGLSLQQMGMLFGVELVAMALSCAATAWQAHRFDRRKVMALCLAVTLVANVGSMFAAGLVTLCAARLVVGVAGGAMQAVVYATAALRSGKERTYATLNMAILVWGAVSLGVLPAVLADFGTAAVFAAFVVLSLLGFALLGAVPRHAGVGARSAPLVQAHALDRQGVLLLVLFVLLFAGHGALWVYQERIGKAIGVSPQQIGMILGLSVLSGALGAALAGWIGPRLGQRAAQAISFAGSILATLVMVEGSGTPAYALTACILMLVWFFGFTYMLAMAAGMDPTGRLSGLANAAVFVGQGLGPAIGAAVVGSGNLRNVGWAAAGVYAVAMVVSALLTSRRGAVAAAAVLERPAR